MKKLSKKITAVFLVVLLTFAGSAVLFASNTDYIPLRPLFEAAGAEVSWDEENDSISANFNGRDFVFFPGSGVLISDGEEAALPFNIVVRDGVSYISYRDVRALFGHGNRAINLALPQRERLYTPFNRPIVLPDVEIRNIILLIPDGMDMSGVTIARWVYAFDPATGYFDLSARLHMDDIVSGLVRTYWSDGARLGGITDSAPAATAMASGHLTNNRFVGVLPCGTPVANVMQAAQELGKATGLIATSNIQHATPAGFSSHHIERNVYAIISEQQVYGNFDVVFGASGGQFVDGRPSDGESMVDSLLARGYQFVTTRDEMLAVTEGRVFGIFGMFNEFMVNELDRPTVAPNEPSLAEMTAKAIELLDQNEEGFLLMVEGSKVDWAAHGNEPVALVSEILAFDAAVGVALDFARECGQTMVIVMSDHGCGGPTIGDSATDSSYPGLPLIQHIAPLAAARGTFESIIVMAFVGGVTDVRTLFAMVYDIHDLTDEEVAAVAALLPHLPLTFEMLRNVIGPIVSRRMNIGWTTHGHTGTDVAFKSFLPGDRRLTGLFTLSDMARIVESAWGLDLADTTERMFNDATTAFESLGAEVEIANAHVVADATMYVTLGDDTLVIPQNKDFVYLNGERHYFTINVFSAGTFFVNQGVIELLR